MKTLYLMRHGQTLFNSLGKIQGWCDSPLTEAGKSEAKRARDFFEREGICFDKAYASTQERACDTLEIVTSQDYQRLKGLKEWNFGLFEGESERLNPKVPYSTEFVAYSGESADEVSCRMLATLTDVMTDLAENEAALAVSHGGACFRFLQTFRDFSTDDRPFFSNCAIQELIFEEGQFHLKRSIDPIHQEVKLYD